MRIQGRPDEDQTERLVEYLQTAIAECVNAQPLLVRAIRDFEGQYPSGGEGGGYVLPEEGEDEEDAQRVSGSLTERRAIEGMRKDAEYAAEALAHMNETIAHIKTLHDQVRRCFPVATANTKLAGCTSCARLKDSKGKPTFAPQHRGDLCSWCYEFQRLWDGRKPTLALVELHSSGQRVSERRIREELGLAKKAV